MIILKVINGQDLLILIILIHETSSNPVWEKRNAFCCESRLDRLGEMFKARDGIEVEQDDHTTILKSSIFDRDYISSREEERRVDKFDCREGRRGCQKAALSRRLVEAKNNKHM